jgi:hypothetical protein
MNIYPKANGLLYFVLKRCVNLSVIVKQHKGKSGKEKVALTRRLQKIKLKSKETP